MSKIPSIALCILLAFGVSGCGLKGKLKSPTQIQNEEAKKARKAAKDAQKNEPADDVAAEPVPAPPAQPEPAPQVAAPSITETPAAATTLPSIAPLMGPR